MHSSPVYVHIAGTNVAGSGKTAELKQKSFIPEEKKSPAVWLDFFLERVTSLRRLVPLALLWLHCRPAGNARQSTGLSDSIIRASSPEKEKPSRLAGLFYGAGDEARTRYLHLGKVALYRMSYTRGTGVLYQISRKCQEGFPRYTKNLGIIPASLLTVLSFSRRKRDLLGAAAWYWAGLFFRKHKQVLN